jgi:hypothetical protein
VSCPRPRLAHIPFPRADHAFEQIGRADEARDKRRRRPLVDLARRGDLLDAPARITAMRSEIASASSWSCVT